MGTIAHQRAREVAGTGRRASRSRGRDGREERERNPPVQLHQRQITAHMVIVAGIPGSRRANRHRAATIPSVEDPARIRAGDGRAARVEDKFEGQGVVNPIVVAERETADVRSGNDAVIRRQDMGRRHQHRRAALRESRLRPQVAHVLMSIFVGAVADGLYRLTGHHHENRQHDRQYQ